MLYSPTSTFPCGAERSGFLVLLSSHLASLRIDKKSKKMRYNEYLLYLCSVLQVKFKRIKYNIQ